MNISEKLEKLGLTSEDQKNIESAITDLITEAVAEKETALKDKYEILSEEYVLKAINEKEEELKKSLNEENDEWKKELESNLIDKIDQFIDSEIDGNISESLLEDTAYLQIAKPIVESIKKTYEENHITIDSEGTKVLAEAKAEVESLKDQLSEAINEKMEAESIGKLGATKLRIIEATQGLEDSDVEKVKNLFENKDFDEVDSKIDNYIFILNEENLKKENNEGKDEINESVILDDDSNGTSEADAKVINSNITIEDMASKYI